MILDVWFPENRPIQRFWLLETVARMPYFSYNSMLTLYEILGWWRKSSDLRKVHFSGRMERVPTFARHGKSRGDRKWSDRFLGQHAALVYYLGLIIIWLISPKLAYNFSERIETHAVATYAQFTEENRALLESLPAPDVAKAYYEGDDLYLFDEFQTTTLSSTGEVMSLKLDKDGTIENAYVDRNTYPCVVQRSKPYRRLYQHMRRRKRTRWDDERVSNRRRDFGYREYHQRVDCVSAWRIRGD